MLGLFVRPSCLGHFGRGVPFAVIDSLRAFGALLPSVERRRLHENVEAFVVEEMTTVHFLHVEIGRGVDYHFRRV